MCISFGVCSLHFLFTLDFISCIYIHFFRAIYFNVIIALVSDWNTYDLSSNDFLFVETYKTRPTTLRR